jgi:K(+)-stimulated pyrophosphate-energized sodium pump
MQGLTFVAPFLGILGLIIAYFIYLYVKKQPNGTPLMQELEGMIHSGAMAFLKREYSVLVFFIAAVFVLLGVFLGEWKTPIAFVTGAFCSMLAGFSGMTAATRGNSRTAEAANKYGQAKALNVSYFSGSVMGLAVASLGLVGLGFWFWYYGGDPTTAKYINGFAMGASSRQQMWEPIWSVRWRQASLRMTPEIPVLSQTTWAIMWEISPGWGQTSLSLMWVQ